MNAENFDTVERPKAADNADKPVRRPGARDVPVATAVMAAVVLYGWWISDENILTPEDDWGYYLGIVGSVMMLLLLLYPLRKRHRALRFIGAVPGWFRLHMVLGIIGPGLVILHSNFNLGSFNSQIALFSMLIVAGSGYIGRFLYGKIHRSLSGRRRTAEELRDKARAHLPSLNLSEDGVDALAEFESKHLRQERSLMRACIRFLAATRTSKQLRSSLLAGSDNPLREARLNKYLAATRKAQLFFIYERAFALWHLLHLPLFLLLVATACLHVVAVHLY